LPRQEGLLEPVDEVLDHGPRFTKGRRPLGTGTCAPDRHRAASLALQVKKQRKEKSKMPGIIVGIDGSDHSRHALEWAIREPSQVTHHARCPVVVIPSGNF
jgi:hypothetical protein